MSASGVGSSSSGKYHFPTHHDKKKSSAAGTSSPITGKVKKAFHATKKSNEAETEDKRVTKVPLRRVSSASALDKTITKEEAIKQKSGLIWDCIDRKPDKSGGFYYSFKLKESFNPKMHPDNPYGAIERLRACEKEISPADEPSHTDLLKLLSVTENKEEYFAIMAKYDVKQLKNSIFGQPAFPAEIKTELTLDSLGFTIYELESNSSVPNELSKDIYNTVNRLLKREKPSSKLNKKIEALIDQLEPYFLEMEKKKFKTTPKGVEIYNEILADAQLLRKFGYKYEVDPKSGDYILTVPDAVTQLAKIETIQKLFEGFPELSLTSADGKSSNRSFIEALLKHHAVVSDGSEFLHDTIIHVSRVIRMMNKLRNPQDNITFKQARNRIVKIEMDLYQILLALRHNVKGVSREGLDMKKIKLLETALAYMVDGISASSDYERLRYIPDEQLKEMDLFGTIPYIQKIFGEDALTFETLPALQSEWSEIKKRVSGELKAVSNELKRKEKRLH